jgi:hypothetical protein
LFLRNREGCVIGVCAALFHRLTPKAQKRGKKGFRAKDAKKKESRKEKEGRRGFAAAAFSPRLRANGLQRLRRHGDRRKARPRRHQGLRAFTVFFASSRETFSSGQGDSTIP